MKKFLIGLLFLVFVSVASAGPFMVSDPQEGATNYQIEFPVLGLTVDTVALADGSLRWDLATYQGPQGWAEGNVRAVATWELVDETSGETSQAQTVSGPSPFRLKKPNVKSSAGYKVVGQ